MTTQHDSGMAQIILTEYKTAKEQNTYIFHKVFQ